MERGWAVFQRTSVGDGGRFHRRRKRQMEREEAGKSLETSRRTHALKVMLIDLLPILFMCLLSR